MRRLDDIPHVELVGIQASRLNHIIVDGTGNVVAKFNAACEKLLTKKGIADHAPPYELIFDQGFGLYYLAYSRLNA